MAEIEQSEDLNVFLDTVNPDGTISPVDEATEFSIPSEQRFRLSIRPKLVFRPHEAVTIGTSIYYKPAIDAPRRVGGKCDERADANAFIEYGFKKSDTGEEKVSLRTEWEWHYDRLPPGLGSETIEAQSAAALLARNPTAPKVHQVYRMLLKIGW